VPPTSDPPLAALLLDALVALPVVIEDIGCAVSDVPVPSYPDGPRPSATVTLSGRGVSGRGEHVDWTREHHERFGVHATEAVPRGRWGLGAWATAMGGRTPWPYARAALEAAAIDLALRQAGTTLGGLVDVPPHPVRFVLSFDRRADPAAEIARWRERVPELRFKIDVDPAWTTETYEALGRLEAVATLDFKGGGSARDHEYAHHVMPEALIEDPAPAAAPWSPSLVARVSFDALVTCAADLTHLPVPPAAINIKPARMGGVLEALRCAAACDVARVPIYLGGMFEIGVGRRQLWALAALLAPGGPNDVAPIVMGTGSAFAALPSVLQAPASSPGFGAIDDEPTSRDDA
jgi:L-alanine-DL-glutamate epimerase-like enolase superfamily enzyme